MDISHFLDFSRGNCLLLFDIFDKNINIDELKQSEHLKNKLIPFWWLQSNRIQRNKEVMR